MSSLSHGITEEKQAPDCFKMFWENGVYMGEAVMNDDGYFVFFPNEDRKGYWDEGMLLCIHTYLKEKNKAWDEHIQEYFR